MSCPFGCGVIVDRTHYYYVMGDMASQSRCPRLTFQIYFFKVLFFKGDVSPSLLERIVESGDPPEPIPLDPPLRQHMVGHPCQYIISAGFYSDRKSTLSLT